MAADWKEKSGCLILKKANYKIKKEADRKEILSIKNLFDQPVLYILNIILFHPK